MFAAAIAALSLLPYLLAYLWAPPGHHFGGFFFIADDATTYLAKMRQGAEGSWLWNDPYTSEPHGGVFLFSFYLLFGHLTALLHLPLIAGYHLARISGAVALIIATDRLCRRLLPFAGLWCTKRAKKGTRADANDDVANRHNDMTKTVSSGLAPSRVASQLDRSYAV